MCVSMSWAHSHTQMYTCKYVCMMCEWALQISCAFQGFQAALLKRPGPEEMAQLKTLVTDDICRDQTDSVLPPPSPKLSGEHRGNIYMAGWAFLINHSLSSHSADQGAVFQWPSPAKVQHFYPNTTPCVLCTCEIVKYSCESIKSTPNEN